MSDSKAQFIEYMEDKTFVFDVSDVGPGVAVLTENQNEPCTFTKAFERGWYASFYDTNEEYKTVVFMPLER